MRSYLAVSGVLFGIVALAHVVRLAFGWPVQIGALSAPLWLSVIGVIVPGSLSVWAFNLARGVRRA
jgi:hypothetical protein